MNGEPASTYFILLNTLQSIRIFIVVGWWRIRTHADKRLYSCGRVCCFMAAADDFVFGRAALTGRRRKDETKVKFSFIFAWLRSISFARAIVCVCVIILTFMNRNYVRSGTEYSHTFCGPNVNTAVWWIYMRPSSGRSTKATLNDGNVCEKHFVNAAIIR